MIKPLQLSFRNDLNEISYIAYALSSPIRLNIIKLLAFKNLTIKDISFEMDMPLNTLLNHIEILEKAKLIATQTSYTTKGKSRSCYRLLDQICITIFDDKDYPFLSPCDEYQIPIGSFFDFSNLTSPCGMTSATEHLGPDNDLSVFLSPERHNASLIWFTSGLLEYRLPLPDKKKLEKLASIVVSFVACSEAPRYNKDYKTDIYLFLNDKKIGVYTSPGDFGGRRGLLNPEFWPIGLTQYGTIVSWKIDRSQTTINENFASFVNISDLHLTKASKPYLSLKIGVEADAVHPKGINLFGKSFGDYPQDICVKYYYDV